MNNIKYLHIPLYYLIWTLGIMLAPKNNLWLLPMMLLLLIQIYIFLKAKLGLRIVILMMIVSITGIFTDSLFDYFNLINFNGAKLWIFAPYWLVTIWFSFMMTFLHLLRQYLNKTWLWSSLGVIFFPITYYIGCQLGAGIWLSPFYATIAYAIFGALIFIYLRALYSLFSK